MFVVSRALAQPGGIRIGDPLDPEKQRAALFKKAQDYYDDGVKLLADGKIVQAKTKFKAAIGLVGFEGPGQAAFGELRRIHEEGMREVERARVLYNEEKFIEALDIAKRAKQIYANLFGGIDLPQSPPNVSRLAKRVIEAIDKNPAAQSQIQERDATKRLAKAVALEKRVAEEPWKYYDLYKTYRSIAKRYPDCPTGRDCADQARKLREDAKIWGTIKKERARRELASALSTIKTLEANGLTTDAENELAKLRKKYPNKSRGELEKMAEEPSR